MKKKNRARTLTRTVFSQVHRAYFVFVNLSSLQINFKIKIIILLQYSIIFLRCLWADSTTLIRLYPFQWKSLEPARKAWSRPRSIAIKRLATRSSHIPVGRCLYLEFAVICSTYN